MICNLIRADMKSAPTFKNASFAKVSARNRGHSPRYAYLAYFFKKVSRRAATERKTVK